MQIFQGLLVFAALIALNAQFYLVFSRSEEVMIASISTAMEPMLARAQREPEEMSRKLEELDRLRATNAALQAVVVSLSSGNTNRSRAAGIDTSMFPALPMPAFVPGKDGPVPSPAIQPDGGVRSALLEKPDAEQLPPAGQLVVTPIRLLDTGGMVYLAADKAVRVARVNGRLYGVDGIYLGEEDGLARISIKGREISLPFIVNKS